MIYEAVNILSLPLPHQAAANRGMPLGSQAPERVYNDKSTIKAYYLKNCTEISRSAEPRHLQSFPAAQCMCVRSEVNFARDATTQIEQTWSIYMHACHRHAWSVRDNPTKASPQWRGPSRQFPPRPCQKGPQMLEANFRRDRMPEPVTKSRI